jgi:hypothetical protein
VFCGWQWRNARGGGRNWFSCAICSANVMFFEISVPRTQVKMDDFFIININCFCLQTVLTAFKIFHNIVAYIKGVTVRRGLESMIGFIALIHSTLNCKYLQP